MLPLKIYIKKPNLLLSAIVKKSSILFLDDKLYLKLRFKLFMGYNLNIENPQTFCEKIQWLKLYNRKLEYTQMVDKYAVKDYVKSIIGEKYIIPTLGVWNSVDDIDFNLLPNKFVLKTTHDGGGVGIFICKDKSLVDVAKLKTKFNMLLKRNNYLSSREWAYKNIVPRIIAETYLENDKDDELTDYKFYCFNGIAKYCQVIKDRKSNETIDFFDRNWNHQVFYGLNPLAKQSSKSIEKPCNYNEMLEIADKLSHNIPFTRIDLYNINGLIFFGEITLYPSGGFGFFSPSEWDKKLGSMIKLPIING